MYATFDKRLFKCDFPEDMIMSVVTTPDGLSIEGHFRGVGNYGGLTWHSEDTWSHETQKYTTSNDYSGVKLSYDFVYSGHLPSLKDEQRGPVITITLTNGAVRYARMWNYIVDRPLDDWEKGSGVTFPRGRTPGNSDGYSGTIVIDFDNFYEGWSEFVWSNAANGWVRSGTDPNEDDHWNKVDPTQIKSLDWGFIPLEYVEPGTNVNTGGITDPELLSHIYSGFVPIRYLNSGQVKLKPGIVLDTSMLFGGLVPAKYLDLSKFNTTAYTPLNDSYYFRAVFSKWTVTGAKYLGTPTILPAHRVRLCDSYDDNYDVTPERLIEQFYNLGYRKVIVLYVGCSHYYDKKAKVVDGGYVKDEYGYYMYEVITDHALNKAYKAWWQNLCHHAKAYGYEEVIGSIAFEHASIPDSWKQIAWDGEAGHTEYVPPPYMVSFTNPDAKEYYKKYVTELVNIQAQVGLTPSIQVGEPWWWIIEDQDKPCFYDAATVALYKSETGKNAPIIKSTRVTEWDANFTKWLGEQNGKFALMVRDTIKALYPSARCGVLFFPPSVLDPSRMGAMVADANFPREQWKYPNFDYFQLEDYDYIIFDQADHNDIYDVAFDLLGYPAEMTHYFSGFVLDHEDANSPLWQRITQALIDSLDRGFETFIWAGPEVRRDDWYAPTTTRDFSLEWLSQEVTNIAWCWRLELSDGTVMGFTSHDVDLVIPDGILNVGTQITTYKSATGFTPTAVETSLDLAVDNLDIDGVIDSDDIKKEDLLSGRYDGAKILIFICNWANPTSQFLIIRKGTLGKVSIGRQAFQAEVRGLMQAYQQPVGMTCQKTCRATLGDTKCKINLANWTYSGTVVSVNIAGDFITNLTQADGFFDYGLITFSTGLNTAGRAYEVKRYSSKEVTLFLPPVFPVSIGDTFTAVAGCDGNFSTCKNRFNNVVNFRGEPQVPGTDYLMSYPSRGSSNVVAEGSSAKR